MRDTAHPKIKQVTDKRTGKPRYVVRYRQANGRQSWKRGFLTKRDAEAWLTATEAAKQRGEFIAVSAGRTRVGALAEAWLAAKAVRVRPTHHRNLEGAWRVHVKDRWEDVAVGAVTTGDVQTWVTALSADRSPTVVLRAHGVLAGILDDAVRDRMILTNPARGVTLPRKRQAPSRYLTHAQVEALAQATGRWSLLVYTLAYCGLRWGEMAALRVRDVNILRRRIKVERSVSYVAGQGFIVGPTKGREARTVAMPAFLTDLMATRIAACDGPDALIFPADRAEYLRQPGAARIVKGRRQVKWWERALEEAGLERMTPHDLRHTAASLAVQSGASVKVVQRMLGHASAAMTLDRYADLFDGDLDDVADRMGRAREHDLSTDKAAVDRSGPSLTVVS